MVRRVNEEARYVKDVRAREDGHFVTILKPFDLLTRKESTLIWIYLMEPNGVLILRQTKEKFIKGAGEILFVNQRDIW